MEDFVTEVYSRLRVRNERLVSVLDDLYNFRESQRQIASSEFLHMINEACELLGEPPRAPEHEPREDTFFDEIHRSIQGKLEAVNSVILQP